MCKRMMKEYSFGLGSRISSLIICSLIIDGVVSERSAPNAHLIDLR